ncbi:hypothetical protein Zmor_026191 [Zophobas morio]|uniref:Lipase domain-containing protein n=1 Tax=Zophobas morio TaxID=2755281 RepID=A0AA38HVL3_9CUCU|nr:hypothetical protein Zmor_026191 [Zophobas morio]
MYQKDNGALAIGYFTDPEAKFFTPEPSEAVSFTLYTRQHPNGTLIEDSIQTYDKIFDKTKPTKFVTHGWMSTGTSDTCIDIKNGFLKKYDANVIIMDWGDIAGNVVYPIPMSASSSVGEYYSQFLNEIVDYGVDPQNIHLVGHSLGAHVSGFAARVVKKGKIGRITALDPAKPGFDNIQLVSGGRLKKDDAGFVDVIHTCAGYLGVGDSIGHADFRPNGGSVPQPGCGNIFEMVEGCSHGRSWIYFAESLVSKTPFMGYPCDSFENFEKSDTCKDGEGVPMGDDTPSSTRGDYYLRTGEAAPFAVKAINTDVNQYDKK